MTLGEKLKKEREKSGYTFGELSKLTNLNRVTLHDYESGKIKNIPSDKIILLSKIYNKDPNYFLLDSQNFHDIEEHSKTIKNINSIIVTNRLLLQSLSIDDEEIEKFLKKYHKFIIKNIK